MLGLHRKRDETRDDPGAVHERKVVAEGPPREGRASDTKGRRDRGRGRNTVRAFFTLAGVAAAGFLLWLASLFELEQTGEFWVAMGLVAAAGFALVLAQLFGGWTKWGVPKISSAVLLIGWLPTAIATAWILLTLQPDGGWQQSRLESWSDDIGILGFVQDVGLFTSAVALAFGVVTGFIFDTTGPRIREREPEATVPDEDVDDYRRRETTTSPEAERTMVTSPAGTATGTREEHVEHRRDAR